MYGLSMVQTNLQIIHALENYFFSFFDEKVKLKYAYIYFPSSWSLKQHRIL